MPRGKRQTNAAKEKVRVGNLAVSTAFYPDFCFENCGLFMPPVAP
jgi:hypothetical protein